MTYLNNSDGSNEKYGTTVKMASPIETFIKCFFMVYFSFFQKLFIISQKSKRNQINSHLHVQVYINHIF